MLKKKFRFRNLNFEKHFKNAKKFDNQFFTILVSDNSLAYPRFCVAPNKKIYRKAVDRNKIRRRIYEIIRINFDKFKPKDYFIMVKKDFSKVKSKQLEEIIFELLGWK